MRRYALPAVLLALAGCPKGEEGPARPTSPVQRVSFDGKFSWEVEAGTSTGSVVVKLHVEPGFHVYTTGETTGRPLALEVDAPAKLADVRYPKGITRNLSIGRSVIVEGDDRITATVEGAAAGADLTGRLRYQVCTDEACDRPRKGGFTLTRP